MLTIGSCPTQGKEHMEKSIATREYRVLITLLRELRRKAGNTQVQLAESIDESQSFVSKLERGEIRIDVVQLRTIALALGMSLPDFVRRYERALAKPKR